MLTKLVLVLAIACVNAGLLPSLSSKRRSSVTASDEYEEDIKENPRRRKLLPKVVSHPDSWYVHQPTKKDIHNPYIIELTPLTPTPLPIFTYYYTSYLMEFHSDSTGSDASSQMEPVLQRLEDDLDTNIRRINVFRRREFMTLLESIGFNECGNMPFYYNRRTGQGNQHIYINTAQFFLFPFSNTLYKATHSCIRFNNLHCCATPFSPSSNDITIFYRHPLHRDSFDSHNFTHTMMASSYRSCGLVWTGLI